MFTTGPMNRGALAGEMAAVAVFVAGSALAIGQPCMEWQDRATTSPDGRSFHSMSYDSARGVAVLFGGQDAWTTNQETWEWHF